MVDKAHPSCHTEATSKEVGAPDGNEVEVTPQMIAAGLDVYLEFDTEHDPYERILSAVFRAMLLARDRERSVAS